MCRDDRPVRRCVCFNVTFATLKAEGVDSLEEAARRFGCGTKCGTCRPYIAEMIRTGETAFPILVDSETL